MVRTGVGRGRQPVFLLTRCKERGGACAAGSGPGSTSTAPAPPHAANRLTAHVLQLMRRLRSPPSSIAFPLHLRTRGDHERCPNAGTSALYISVRLKMTDLPVVEYL